MLTPLAKTKGKNTVAPVSHIGENYPPVNEWKLLAGLQLTVVGGHKMHYTGLQNASCYIVLAILFFCCVVPENIHTPSQKGFFLWPPSLLEFPKSAHKMDCPRLNYQPLFRKKASTPKLTAELVDLALLISTNKKSACLNRAGCIN